jgi:hypothetical protein
MIHKALTYFKIRQPFILYPWLIVILFILQKIDLPELHPAWRDIFIFFIMNVFVLLVSFCILKVFIKERLKTWLIVSVLMVVLLNWSTIFELLSRWTFFNEILNSLPHILRQLVYLSILILIIYLSTKYKGSLLKISQYLNVLLIALIIYQIFAIFFQDTTKIKLADKVEIIDTRQQKINNNLPDIYYIILDAYTSNQSLKDYWDYNNDEFTDFLTGKGFYIAANSKTNYNLTLYSVSSSLNMSYLTNLPKKKTEGLAHIKNLSKLVEESQIVKILLKNGYQIENCSFLDLPKSSRYYDDFIYFKKVDLFESTAFKRVLNKMNIKCSNDNNRADLISFGVSSPLLAA